MMGKRQLPTFESSVRRSHVSEGLMLGPCSTGSAAEEEFSATQRNTPCALCPCTNNTRDPNTFAFILLTVLTLPYPSSTLVLRLLTVATVTGTLASKWQLQLKRGGISLWKIKAQNRRCMMGKRQIPTFES
uniref:Uncharacterized protein n=1 Tax=Xenopus tropicalis TaxID=8364 RepID=A0A1B8Y994_XENTR